MDDAENNSCKTTVKKEIEEDWSNSELIHESTSTGQNKQKCKQEVDYHIEENGSISVDSIKKECKQEVDWESVEVECSPGYAEKLDFLPNLEMNFNVMPHNQQELFQCPKCPVKAKYEANLNRHISFMHPKNKPVQMTPGRIASHSLQKACEKKNFLFKNKMSENHEFVQNESVNHTQLTKKRKYAYSCSNCFFNCNYKQDLVYHVYQFHFNNNDSQNECSACPCCKKKFYRHQIQKAHMHYCTMEKIFQCDHCSYNSKLKGDLKRHIFVKHFVYGDFQNGPPEQHILPACPKCGRRYKYSLQLSNHIAFCGKPLPFQCKACLYASDIKSNFIIHILAHLKKSNLCQDLA